MLAEPLPEPMGRAELRTALEEAGGPPIVDVTEQIVVVMLTTVVDVSTTVALAGQFEASVAHLVTVNVDVVRTTAVVTSLSARGKSVHQSVKFESRQRSRADWVCTIALADAVLAPSGQIRRVSSTYFEQPAAGLRSPRLRRGQTAGAPSWRGHS